MAIEDKITAIANSIRSKTGETDLLTLDEMPAKINNISGGSGSNDFDKYIEGTLTEFTSNVETIRSQGLWWGTFETANFPEAKRIEASAFWECTKMKNLYLPKVEFRGNSGLYSSSGLTRLDLPSIKRIEGYAFCFSNITTIVIGTTDCVLSDDYAFADIYSSCIVYVPDEALESYRTATNWVAALAWNPSITLKGISELPTE